MKTPPSKSDWREEYGFPVIYQSALRYGGVARPIGESDAPVKAYYHFHTLADRMVRYGGFPNVDTLYGSVAQFTDYRIG